MKKSKDCSKGTDPVALAINATKLALVTDKSWKYDSYVPYTSSNGLLFIRMSNVKQFEVQHSYHLDFSHSNVKGDIPEFAEFPSLI